MYENANIGYRAKYCNVVTRINHTVARVLHLLADRDRRQWCIKKSWSLASLSAQQLILYYTRATQCKEKALFIDGHDGWGAINIHSRERHLIGQ